MIKVQHAVFEGHGHTVASVAREVLAGCRCRGTPVERRSGSSSRSGSRSVSGLANVIGWVLAVGAFGCVVRVVTAIVSRPLSAERVTIVGRDRLGDGDRQPAIALESRQDRWCSVVGEFRTRAGPLPRISNMEPRAVGQDTRASKPRRRIRWRAPPKSNTGVLLSEPVSCAHASQRR